ncbi:sporulation protein [Haloglomus halophilum]|uniref:sporulation protein n=1 Tax=Haloglomus halophilum TaxID=2962672 RepID=UPI0020C9765F|nr:sporulation protein [Haloglomus halophilum]
MGLLSRLGIGNATVDTVFPTTRVTAGDSVTVRVEIEGGRDRQHAQELVVGLLTRAETGNGERVVEVSRTTLAEDLEVTPETDRLLETSVDIPPWTPITRHGTEVWVDTDLAIDWGVDSHAEDALHVEPGERLRLALQELAELGFVPHRAVPLAGEGERVAAPGVDGDHPVVQQFDCHPRSGSFVGSVRRLTVVAVPTVADLRLHLRVDMDTDVVYEATGAYELSIGITVTDEGPAELRHRLERAIGGRGS